MKALSVLVFLWDVNKWICLYSGLMSLGKTANEVFQNKTKPPCPSPFFVPDTSSPPHKLHLVFLFQLFKFTCLRLILSFSFLFFSIKMYCLCSQTVLVYQNCVTVLFSQMNKLCLRISGTMEDWWKNKHTNQPANQPTKNHLYLPK